MRRALTILSMGVRMLVRQPLLVVLLFFLPAYMVGVFSAVAPATPVSFDLGSGAEVTVPLSELLPAVTAPMAAALLGGIAGLFVVRSTARPDRRLVVAGIGATRVVIARMLLLVGVGVVGTAAALAALRVVLAPNQLVWFASAVLLNALVYSLVGMVVGMLLGRLLGVYVILFGSLIDLFLFQNPLATEVPVGARFTPGHFPMQAAVDAAFGLDAPIGAVLLGLAVLGALAVAVSLLARRAVHAP